MRRSIPLALFAAVAACSSSNGPPPAQVAGDYTLTVTDGQNGCNVQNFTTNATQTGIIQRHGQRQLRLRRAGAVLLVADVHRVALKLSVIVSGRWSLQASHFSGAPSSTERTARRQRSGRNT